MAGSRTYAQDLHLEGMADARLVIPSAQASNLDGGLGKFRYGDARGAGVLPEFGGLVLRGVAGLTPELRLVAEARYDPQQKTTLDLLDAYLRWRPVSTTRWRWSVKAGAFFLPVSEDNGGIGWTSEWTVTPSAINAWVGDELRTIGTEATLEWRGDVDRISWILSAFGWNEPAGVAIANRGWSFNDRPLGLFDHIRLPNVAAQPAAPYYNNEFRQLDHAIGWYAGIAWDRPDLGRISVLHYDNHADPAARDTELGWRTKFWSLSAATELGPLVVMAQGMAGSTAVAPAANFTSLTDFWAAYVLVGIERGAWRYAVRLDRFGTSEHNPGGGISMSEQGIAGTAAVTWTANQRLRVVGEVVTINSSRPQRVLLGKPVRLLETQAQIVARMSF